MISAGDYLILKLVQGKKVLAKSTVVSKDGSKFKALLEQDISSGAEATPFEASCKEVVANLGNSPTSGKVYGVNVEPLRESLTSAFWGDIKIYHAVDDTTRRELKKSLKEAEALLTKLRVPEIPVTVHVKTQNSKVLGYYKYQPKAEEDILCVKIDESIDDMNYKFAHEYAHGIWFRCFTPKMRMAWVRMYHASLEIQQVSEKELNELLEDIKTFGDVRGFAKENPDTLPTLKVVFRHMKQTHNLDRSHFDMALVLGEEVDEFWPTAVELTDKQTILTTYATKSPEELWAEAFSLKAVGKKLPAKISDLVDKCMRTWLRND